MLREITKKVKHPETGKLFKKVGDKIDLPLATWKGIARSLFPKADDLMKALEGFTKQVEVK